MEMKDLQKKNIDECKKMLEEKAVALNTFKFGVSGSKVKNTQEGKNLKKEIAQILTFMKESKKVK